MYTQCPDCRKVYPLDSALNPEDKTRMYCNTCARDFNVLELLTENPLGLLSDAAPVIPPVKAEVDKAAKPKTRAKKKRKTSTSAKVSQEVHVIDSPVEVIPALRPAAETIFIPASTPALDIVDAPLQDERLPWENEKPAFLDRLAAFKLPARRENADESWHQAFSEHSKKIYTLTTHAQQGNWQLASLAGLVLLIGQLICYSADEFSQSQLYRPYLEKACQLFGCHLDEYAHINEFEVLQGSFTTNPDKSITFKAVISNQAAFRQKLPYVKLTLVNQEELMFAQRFFTPAEYLGGNQIRPDIGPDESREVQLIIAEPQTAISGYFFDLTY